MLAVKVIGPAVAFYLRVQAYLLILAHLIRLLPALFVILSVLYYRYLY